MPNHRALLQSASIAAPPSIISPLLQTPVAGGRLKVLLAQGIVFAQRTVAALELHHLEINKEVDDTSPRSLP
jgi:hypothetical protein